MLYLVFTISGAAGLIYESIWTRYLALFVGHSAYAQVIVLTIFLGGMSAGALWVGQRSERLRDPLLWYAAVEAAAGIVGLLFHQAYGLSTAWAYQRLFPALVGSTSLLIGKWALASALILPQSVLLGATFPLMSAGVLRRRPQQPGRVLAILYFANSFGAAFGPLLAGFYLTALVGLPGTILTAATCNLLVAAVAYLAARSEAAPARIETVADSGTPEEPALRADKRLPLLLLIVAFGTAVASFVYEISWIRMLALVLGSATHSFELMLSAFILGLALGALWVRRRADAFSDPVGALGIVQLVMGAAALATLPVYLHAFHWMQTLLYTFAKTDQGYDGFNLARYAICLAVMLPSTFCAGMTLPLITNILLHARLGERVIGWVYGVNTFGSIASVITASLVLLPLIGLRPLLLVGGATDMCLGVLLLAYVQRGARRRVLGAGWAAAAAVAVLAVIAWSTPFDQAMLSSGVYRHGSLQWSPGTQVVFYRDGRTATVAVIREADGGVSLLTNGKPDASLAPEWFQPAPAAAEQQLHGDSQTQIMLSLVSLAFAPHAATGAVIGHGSGISSHLLLGSPYLSRLVTIDIEPQMVEGARLFYPLNARVFDDPRSVVVFDDARSYLASHPGPYDVIMSEPSNPWVSGVSGLFTLEFYRQIAPRLSPSGVFGQWLQLYELNDGLALSVIAAIHAAFRSYAVFLVDDGNLLIVASNQAELPPPDWTVASYPAIAGDLRRFRPFTPEVFEPTRLLDRDTLAPLFTHWRQPNSDYFPTLDLGAERSEYLKEGARGFAELGREWFDVVAAFRQAPRGAAETRAPLTHARLQALARSARLQRALATGDFTADAMLPGLAAAMQRLWNWQRLVEQADGPPDWKIWLEQTMQVEADLHGGTAGVRDERFFRLAHAYAEHHDAPADVREVLSFADAVAGWDFRRAADLSDAVCDAVVQQRFDIPLDAVRDAAIMAKLAVGDAAGARRLSDGLRTTLGRKDNDLRGRLLQAYVDDGLRTAALRGVRVADRRRR